MGQAKQRDGASEDCKKPSSQQGAELATACRRPPTPCFVFSRRLLLLFNPLSLDVFGGLLREY